MLDRGPPLRTERVTAANRQPAMAGAIVTAVLIVLALAKPWDDGTQTHVPSAIASPASVGVTSVSIAAPTRVPDATMDPLMARKQCQDPNLWRLVTVERSGPLEGRSLLPVTLVAAAGPADPRIVPQIVRAGALLALGYCLPTEIHADVTSTERDVQIWQAVVDGGPIPLADAEVADLALAAVGEVYLTPGTSSSRGENAAVRAPPTWPEGRYVFEMPADQPGGVPGWFAFEFSATAVAVGGSQR